MKRLYATISVVTLSVASTFACARSRAADTIPVTVDNFVLELHGPPLSPAG